jgi:nitrous oxidase accessory protein
MKNLFFILLVSLWFITTDVVAQTSLQKLIDDTPAGKILIPPAGVYRGSITISKAITIDGKGKVTIDAGNKGSVVYLNADGVTIKNLTIINSGDSHNDIDAGVQVRGNFNVIKDLVIKECLFGVDLGQAENNIIKRNKISSKTNNTLGMKGDAIRLWYSFNNQIKDNHISDARDVVVWYSKDNVISGNKTVGGRYALHFMYSQANLVENNSYVGGSVGIFLMYSDSVTIKNNYIAKSQGVTGMGIGIKETSDSKIIGNKILYCATGLFSDNSPFQPDTTNIIKDNLIAFNNIGFLFHSPWWGNKISNNIFKDNINQVVVNGNGGATKNQWDGNYWDDYEGFDNNKDDIGDTPYELYSYADRIWADVPQARFFKATPILEVLDFLERLAPFSQPQLILQDNKPLKKQPKFNKYSEKAKLL